MASFRLAAVIKNPSSSDFIVTKKVPPPPSEDEYRQFVDSDLWDLPSTLLQPLKDDQQRFEIAIQGADSNSDKLDLGALDVRSALDQVASQVNMEVAFVDNWGCMKYVEEPEFGPGPPINTLFVLGILDSKLESSQDRCRWMSKDSALEMLLEVNKGCDRIGPLVFVGLLHDSTDIEKWKAPQTFLYQEYPPGVMLIPMRSRTGQPFRTTNLVVMVRQNSITKSEDSDCVACGDALIMDPGCCTQAHSELADLVASLPRKLVIFITHHHYDHTDGLSVVQKCNPDSILLAHENTMNQIGKEAWSLGYTSISGGEKISIGGQIFEALFAPGHTDGHLALLHGSTNALIVGDHCVGHGSAVLDVTAGGNMKAVLYGLFSDNIQVFGDLTTCADTDAW